MLARLLLDDDSDEKIGYSVQPSGGGKQKLMLSASDCFDFDQIVSTRETVERQFDLLAIQAVDL